ncbi:MAG TPA: hypothetical protein VMB79_17895 [Jatrophihabitans sp.]|nr:hypothetical protein [Jatrophihabitans sp.]
MTSALDAARQVADAVMYEGYLLYPYRSSSSKNRLRWQFGVLGPPQAPAGTGEPATLGAECLLRASGPGDRLTVHLRFLQLQARQVYDGAGRPVPLLAAGGDSWTSWEEAVPHEIELGPYRLDELRTGCVVPVEVPGGREAEPLPDGARLVRSRLPLRAELSLVLTECGPVRRLRLSLANRTDGPVPDRAAASARSLLGSHLLLRAAGPRFVSLLEPPAGAAEAARQCVQDRCWPVLIGAGDDLLLISPIILYDRPEVAAESAGELFDATEIDELLTLRVLTLTDQEKAEARATDPHAAAIVDRCEAMSPAQLQRLHGALRDPPDVPAGAEPPWWDPVADASVAPERDVVEVDGIPVSRGSRVRLRPGRRADAQDLFLAGQPARVTAVFGDVDGQRHVAVVLEDDPAADLHEWYGRYLYFAPDELEPLPEPAGGAADRGEEV